MSFFDNDMWPIYFILYGMLGLSVIILVISVSAIVNSDDCKEQYGPGYSYFVSRGCVYEEQEYYLDTAKPLKKRE